MRSERSVVVTPVRPLTVMVVAFAACGGDDDDSSSGGSDSTNSTTEGKSGGEFVDLGTFVGDPPEHIDPALNTTLDAYQVINAMYDGLTEIDASDPENPVIKPLVAESFESNDDASCGRSRSATARRSPNGEQILPSTFARAWERASNPDFAGDYSYLFNFIEGGAEKLDGEADTLSGVDGRRRGDDPQGHALRAVLELPGRGRLPAVLPDARRPSTS